MTTTLPVAEESTVDDVPRELHRRTLDDILSLAGSAIGAFGLDWVLYQNILPVHGILGFVICWYLAFLLLYGVVTAMDNPRPVVTDRLAAAAVHCGAFLVGLALVSAVVFIFVRGVPRPCPTSTCTPATWPGYARRIRSPGAACCTRSSAR
jgi:phosphate transport system permease protein